MICDSHIIRLYCTQSILIPCTDPTRWTNKRREDRAKRCHIQTKTVKVHIFASIVWNIHCFMLGLRSATLSSCPPSVIQVSLYLYDRVLVLVLVYLSFIFVLMCYTPIHDVMLELYLSLYLFGLRIADISHYRTCTFLKLVYFLVQRTWNVGLFWLCVAILLQIYAFYQV